MLESLVGLLLDVVPSLTGFAVMFVFSLGRVRPKPKNHLLATIIDQIAWLNRCRVDLSA